MVFPPDPNRHMARDPYFAGPDDPTLPIAPHGASPTPPTFPSLYAPPAGPAFTPDPYQLGARIPSRPASSPRSPAAGRRANLGAIVLGVVSAFLVVGLIGIGLAYASGRGDLFNKILGVSGSATATPTSSASATKTPVAVVHITPTSAPAPTVTDTPMPPPTATVAATPAVGYQTYDAVSGLWSMNVPSDATITPGTFTVQGMPAPDVAFGLNQTTTMTVYEIPQPIPDDQAQAIFLAILAQTGATNVSIIEQPHQVVIGTNQWSEAVVAATLQGQPIEVSVLYAAHGTGAMALSAQAPTATFASARTQAFLPIEQSFFFLV